MNTVALNQFEYDVKGGEIDAIVHLGQKSCSCREFDIDRIPCVHALAAMEDKDFERVAQLCSEFCKVDIWVLAYFENIYLVPAMSEWDFQEGVELPNVLPPIIKKKHGITKKRRFPSVGETRQKTGRRNRCAWCREIGHYQKNCYQRPTMSNSS